jgi:hypothetical protein|tara:strand:- start:292 stop:711 length:420 start_codon:yes stop_codon:yes gene_type:complete
MISSLILPFLLNMTTISILLNDGFEIKGQFVQAGTVSASSGFLFRIGDVADIQASISSNSCLIRIEELRQRFENQVKSTNDRCKKRLQFLQDALAKQENINTLLKEDLESERTASTRWKWGAVVSATALTGLSIYLGVR